MASLHIKTDDGREVEISSGSHVYEKRDGTEEIFWAWDKIPVAHDALNNILAMNEQILQKVDEVLPHLPKNAIK